MRKQQMPHSASRYELDQALEAIWSTFGPTVHQALEGVLREMEHEGGYIVSDIWEYLYRVARRLES